MLKFLCLQLLTNSWELQWALSLESYLSKEDIVLWRIGALGLGGISVRCFFQWNYFVSQCTGKFIRFTRWVGDCLI
jgi:hypothetical protein